MTTHRFRTWTRSAALLALALAAACGDGPTASPGTPPAVTEVDVSPGSFALGVGETHALSATPRAADGAALPGRAVAWSSSDTAVATVSATGVVQAVAAGTAVITARSETRTGRATVTVQPAPVLSVQITPGGAQILLPGATRQLGALALGANQAVLPGRTATWTSSDTAVAWVSATGLLQARAVGSAVVSATVEGKTAQAEVSVLSEVARVELDRDTVVLGVGDLHAVVARALTAGGGVLDRAFTWTSDNSAVAVVDSAGRVTARGNGTTRVTAGSEGRSASVIVKVSTWSTWTLLSAGGEALPATLFTRTVNDASGAARTQRFQATGGMLRIRGVDGRFELRTVGWLTTEGSPAVQATLGSEGTHMYDVFNGDLLLHTGGATFRGRHDEDGRLTLTWRPQPGAAEVALVFDAP